MPLIVEDGTCPENANSYVSLEQADAYLVPRNLWPVYEAEKPVEPEEPETPDNSELPDGEDTNQAGSQIEGLQSRAMRADEKEEEKAENTGSGEIGSENPDEPQEPEPELPDTSKPDDNPEIAKKETALMRAFDYLDTLKWKGQRIDWQRQTAWPRKNVPVPGCNLGRLEYIPDDIVPDAVKKAQMELAALIYNGVDMFKPLERGGQYKQQSDSYSKSVDVLSKSESHSIAYANNAPKDTWLPSVYPLLRDFLDEVPGETHGFSVHNVLRG